MLIQTESTDEAGCLVTLKYWTNEKLLKAGIINISYINIRSINHLYVKGFAGQTLQAA